MKRFTEHDPHGRLTILYGLLIGLCGVLFIVSEAFVVIQAKQHAQQKFSHKSEELYQGLNQMFAINETILDGFAAFLADVGMQDPERARFYTRTIMNRYPHLYMFQAAQRIAAEDVVEFEKRMDATLPDNRNIRVRRFVFGQGVVPVNVMIPRDYYPIVFVEPEFNVDFNVLGLDISSIQFVQDAMFTALNTTLASISQPFELSDGSPAFVMIKPSILPGQSTPDQYALIVVKSADVFKSEPFTHDGMQLYVANEKDEPIIFKKSPSISQLEAKLFPELEEHKTIALGGQSIRFVLRQQLGFSHVNFPYVVFVLIAYLLIALLIHLYMKSQFEAEKLKEKSNLRLFKQANFDQLTGLANRHYFESQFIRSVASCDRRHAKAAILYIDLNDFKPINDTLGHLIGDKVLKVAASEIKQVIRSDDLACRFGGDEFIVLLENLKSPENAVRVMGSIHEQFAKITRIEDYDIVLSASIGMSIYPDDGQTLTDLVRKADKKMYENKRQFKINKKLIETNRADSQSSEN